jgi:hypothetical protein
MIDEVDHTGALACVTSFRAHSRHFALQKKTASLLPDHCRAHRGRARSDRRAADQPHRTGETYARAIQMRRQRFAEGRDGG